MNIISDTPDIRDAVRAWAVDYVAARDRYADSLRNNSAFRARVEAWIADSDSVFAYTLEDGIAAAVRESDWERPVFPSIAVPSWASEARVEYETGGEVSVALDHPFVTEPGQPAVATLSTWVSVVVDDDPKFARNHPGAQVGDVLPGEPPTITIEQRYREDLDADGARVLAKALLDAVTVLDGVTG